MTTRPKPQCLACAHWVSPLDSGRDERACSAFPQGIPDDIWWNRFDHREPHKGDHGIQWESDGTKFPEWAMNTATA